VRRAGLAIISWTDVIWQELSRCQLGHCWKSDMTEIKTRASGRMNLLLKLLKSERPLLVVQVFISYDGDCLHALHKLRVGPANSFLDVPEHDALPIHRTCKLLITQHLSVRSEARISPLIGQTGVPLDQLKLQTWLP
jgi:hypothetical protein